jgi:hypothetical protein
MVYGGRTQQTSSEGINKHENLYEKSHRTWKRIKIKIKIKRKEKKQKESQGELESKIQRKTPVCADARRANETPGNQGRAMVKLSVH